VSQNPRLHIELFEHVPAEFGGFGFGNRIAVVDTAIKVGWAWYSRFPPAAYFTLRQTDPLSKIIRPGLTHINIHFIDDATGYVANVYTGRMGDADESGGDIVWRSYGYMAELALSRTGYRIMYGGKKISYVIAQEWKGHKSGDQKLDHYGVKQRSYSLNGFMRTGVIETPLNDSGAPILLDPQFGVIDTPRLLLFYDLTEIGRANTRKNVVYQVTRGLDPMFRFVADAGVHRSEIQMNFPGNVRDFRFVRGVSDIRNDLATIGSKQGQSVEIVRRISDGTYGYERFGRRQDTYAIKTLSGFNNLDTDAGKFSAQKLITERAVRESTRPTRSLQLDIPWQKLMPFEGYFVDDSFDVEINTDDTKLKHDYRLLGITGTMDEAGYRQQLFLTTDEDIVDD
jgi:hypothetical protein